MVEFMRFVKLFLIYSILGYLLETLGTVYYDKHFNSGILKGPFTIIYGIAIFIILGLNYFTKKIKDRKKEVITFYVLITIILTVLEYSAGMMIYKSTGKIYWDYDKLPFCFNHFISLFTSLLFGLGATIMNYYIAPKINKIIYKIPNYVILFLLLTFIIDIVKYIFI